VYRHGPVADVRIKTQELQELKRELQVVEKCLVELPVQDGAAADATAEGEEIS